MERIIKAIEEKLASQETTIFVQKHQIEVLESKLAEAEKTIAEQQTVILKQGRIINTLKGETE